MLKKIVWSFLIVGCLAGAYGYLYFSSFVSWKEEVQLNDGRVIVVEQKKRIGGLMAREAWLMIDLHEFSDKPIVWHENLSPLMLNIDGGHLYVVGIPKTDEQFWKYGNPQPAYVGFIWRSGEWNRIPFASIPGAIYTTNMLIEQFPPKGTTLLTLENKNSREVNGACCYSSGLHQIESTFKY